MLFSSIMYAIITYEQVVYCWSWLIYAVLLQMSKLLPLLLYSCSWPLQWREREIEISQKLVFLDVYDKLTNYFF